MEVERRGEADRAAKELFGRLLRVRLAEWILARAGEPFFLQEAQMGMQLLGEARSGVSKELAVFQTHGMVSSTADGRRVYYVARPSDYWDAFAAIVVALGPARTLPDHTAPKSAHLHEGAPD